MIDSRAAIVSLLAKRKGRRLARAEASAVTSKDLSEAKLLDVLRRYKKRPKPLPHRPYPHAAEVAYREALLSFTRSLQAPVMAALAPIFAELEREQAARKDAKDTRSTVARVRASLEKQAEREAKRLARRGIDLVNQRSLADLNRQFGAALEGVTLFSSVSPSAQRILDAALGENVKLIKSIPVQLLGQVEDVVSSGIERGARVETLRKEVQERFEVSESRAELIARDQVGKINGQLVEARCGELGMDGYVWQTSQDERVRGTPGGVWPKGSHYGLNQTKQKFSAPPIVDEATGRRANPGEDYQCRCNALPDVDGMLERLGI